MDGGILTRTLGLVIMTFQSRYLFEIIQYAYFIEVIIVVGFVVRVMLGSM